MAVPQLYFDLEPLSDLSLSLSESDIKQISIYQISNYQNFFRYMDIFQSYQIPEVLCHYVCHIGTMFLVKKCLFIFIFISFLSLSMFVNHACAAWAFGPYAKSAVTLMMCPGPLVMGVYRA